ncbi:MAG: methionine--tRNA ligase subunit beta, partial [Muribaculaceae bacterium]|nr:methionine--tRNA ligase subunit beta [Muribaculaceae bacterium]
ARNNNELVAILGNFVNRATVLIHKYYGGMVPACGDFSDEDRKMMEEVKESVKALSENLDQFKFREGLKDAMNIARIGNKYLADSEPWKLIKTDPVRTATILNLALQVCANLAVVFEPFTPFMAAKLASQLRINELKWEMAGRFDLVADGVEIGTPELLFEKVEDSVVEAQIKKLEDAKARNILDNWNPNPVKETVDFPTFEKMDIRVGKVLECEKVPKADKLLKFKIDDGMGGRTIVSGIAKFYNPEDLVGKEVCFIANFAPRKLKGVESQGMILSAEDSDGRLVVIGPTGEVRPGCSVG